MQEILEEPQRKAAEEAFAREHANDTDEELLEHLYQTKKNNRGAAFKRRNFIGYTYYLERFGQWEKAITPVNERLAADKAQRKKEREAAEQAAKGKNEA